MFVVTEGLKHSPSRSFVSCRFWTEIRGSLRSWWEQGFIQMVVSGRQEMLGSPVMFLPQVSSISQLGGFIRGLQFTCSGGRVSSGSRHHQSALCVFCLRFISRTLVSPIMLMESVFGWWVLFSPPSFRHWGTRLFRALCPSGYDFLGKRHTNQQSKNPNTLLSLSTVRNVKGKQHVVTFQQLETNVWHFFQKTDQLMFAAMCLWPNIWLLPSAIRLLSC